MGAGFDFTEDEDALREEQLKGYEQANLWENLTEKDITLEINGVNSRVTALVLDLERMIGDNDYEKMIKRRDAVCLNDLSHEGWIHTFHEMNRESFPNQAPAPANSKPSWYRSLPAEKQKAYDTAFAYHQDTMFLMNTCDVLYDLLMTIPLKDGFRILRLKENFEEAGFTKALYEKIDIDAAAVSEQLNQSFAEMEKNARRSQIFYDDNFGLLSVQSLDKGYREQRIKDYLDNIKRSLVYDSLVDRGDGTFGVKPDVLAKMKVIDNYTYEVSQIKNLDARLEKTLEKCRKARNEYLALNDKSCKTEACRNLIASFENLVDAVQSFAEFSLEAYKNFRNGESRAPYCYMKPLPAASRIRPKYVFDPKLRNPWESGTYFEEMYIEAKVSVIRHCREFVYDHGHQAIRQ